MVLLIVGLILTVIVVDILNNRPDRRGENPYALKVDQYREVDPELISHKEARNFSMGLLIATDMSYFNRTLYISGNSSLVVLPLDGAPATMLAIPPRAGSLEVDEQHIFVYEHGLSPKAARHSRIFTLSIIPTP